MMMWHVVLLVWAFVFVAVIILYVIGLSDTTQDDSVDPDDDLTYRYCSMAVDPETPPQYCDGGFTPPEYRCVLEQADDGSYRVRRLAAVMNSAMNDSDEDNKNE